MHFKVNDEVKLSQLEIESFDIFRFKIWVIIIHVHRTWDELKAPLIHPCIINPSINPSINQSVIIISINYLPIRIFIE
jgi:hypothetical protein